MHARSGQLPVDFFFIPFGLIYSLKGYLTVILDPVNLGNLARRTAFAKHLPVEVPE